MYPLAAWLHVPESDATLASARSVIAYHSIDKNGSQVDEFCGLFLCDTLDA